LSETKFGLKLFVACMRAKKEEGPRRGETRVLLLWPGGGGSGAMPEDSFCGAISRRKGNEKNPPLLRHAANNGSGGGKQKEEKEWVKGGEKEGEGGLPAQFLLRIQAPHVGKKMERKVRLRLYLSLLCSQWKGSRRRE